MYHHGICTLMLAEAAGMTDGKLGKEIRKKLVKAVDVILKAQRDGDGRTAAAGATRWPTSSGSDISVTGWQIMALRPPRTSAATCRPTNIDRAVDFIKRCQDPRSGGFRYQPNANLTVPCTGTSILALEIVRQGLAPQPRSAAGPARTC